MPAEGFICGVTIGPERVRWVPAMAPRTRPGGGAVIGGASASAAIQRQGRCARTGRRRHVGTGKPGPNGSAVAIRPLTRHLFQKLAGGVVGQNLAAGLTGGAVVDRVGPVLNRPDPLLA